MPADVVLALQGTFSDRSLIAWGKVQGAIGRVGYVRSVAFDDAAIHAAIDDMGGWAKMCSTTYDELPFVQKQFIAAHKAYLSRGKFAYPNYLMCQSEVDNRTRGFPIKPPVLIGDERLACVVISGGNLLRIRAPMALLNGLDTTVAGSGHA
jgi:hypothetical protein